MCVTYCTVLQMEPSLSLLVSRFTMVFRLRQDKRRNESIQSQVGRKDLNKYRSDKECIATTVDLSTRITCKSHLFPRCCHIRLCSYRSRSSVRRNTNCQATGQTTQSTAQTGCQMRKSGILRVRSKASFCFRSRKLSIENDCYNESVNTQNTCHDNRNNILHEQFRRSNAHGHEALTSLGSTIGASQV